MARVPSTNFRIRKMAGCVKEIDVVDESNEEIERVSKEKDAQNTKKSTKFAIQAFRALRDLQTVEESVENLENRLATFFANAKKNDSKYKASALETLRSGLRRYYLDLASILFATRLSLILPKILQHKKSTCDEKVSEL